MSSPAVNGDVRRTHIADVTGEGITRRGRIYQNTRRGADSPPDGRRNNTGGSETNLRRVVERDCVGNGRRNDKGETGVAWRANIARIRKVSVPSTLTGRNQAVRGVKLTAGSWGRRSPLPGAGWRRRRRLERARGELNQAVGGSAIRVPPRAAPRNRGDTVYLTWANGEGIHASYRTARIHASREDRDSTRSITIPRPK